MVYKVTSCQEVIAKVMADLNVGDSGQRVTDFIEWIAEALEKIGGIKQLDYKMSGAEEVPVFKIENYQITLPNDLYTLEQVAYSMFENGPWVPMRSNTGSFKSYPDKHDPATLTTVGSMNDELTWPILGVTPGNRNMTNYSVDPQYFVKPGFIVTNRKEGYLKLAYYAQLTDCNDYPMIPDVDSVKEAVYWYIVMKLKYPEFLDGRMNENRYFDIRNNWNFYRKQAYAEIIMPSGDEMISIKNQWLQLVPDIDAERSFYSNVGQAQKIYNNYYGRVF